MSFGEPGLLWFLWIFPLALLLIALAIRRRRRAQQALISSRLFHRMVPGFDQPRIRWKAALFLIGLASLLFALPRPQIGSELAEVKRRGLDVLVALDTSRSMLAEDLRPNRMAAAKREVEDLFRLLRGNRLGLITFAGESITNCPLTLDSDAASLFLDGIFVNSITTPGTNLAKAIERGIQAFHSDDRRFKVLVLVTDGEGHEGDVLKVAREAADAGVVIFTIGVGTTDGHTVPIRHEETGALQENLRDRSGKPVFSRLERSTLQQVAAITGGAYYESSGGSLDLEHLRNTIATMETRELSGRQARKPIERYQIFVALALTALTLEAIIRERKREELVWTGRF
ncbi:MAG: VWA domain-containing protein [bacterium]|nr:VWA domain-containing protein [bacterium]